MHSDFKELLSVLNAHNVKYLVVGAHAVSAHAQPRATKDLDIFIQASPENARAVYRALAQFGAPLEGLTPDDFAQPGSFFHMGRAPVAVDVMTEIPGVDFDAAWEHRIEDLVDLAVRAFFISRDDLIATKLASGRPQDLADVDAIRRAGDSQRTKKRQG